MSDLLADEIVELFADVLRAATAFIESPGGFMPFGVVELSDGRGRSIVGMDGTDSGRSVDDVFRAVRARIRAGYEDGSVVRSALSVTGRIRDAEKAQDVLVTWIEATGEEPMQVVTPFASEGGETVFGEPAFIADEPRPAADVGPG